MCTGTTPACGNTCARGAGTHGDVLNLHTEVFSACQAAPHTTPHTQHNTHTHTTHNTHTHTHTHTTHTHTTHNTQHTTPHNTTQHHTTPRNNTRQHTTTHDNTRRQTDRDRESGQRKRERRVKCDMHCELQESCFFYMSGYTHKTEVHV